jgi:hypothetical protein
MVELETDDEYDKITSQNHCMLVRDHVFGF